MITQIGSLPFSDIKQAIDYSINHDIPFLPELTFNIVKVQCIGPATLIMAGYEQDEAVGRCHDHIQAILPLKLKKVEK